MNQEHKERPIIFSDAMVRAILSGKKMQTRRVCKPANANNLSFVVVGDKDAMTPAIIADNCTWGDEEGEIAFTCPYGVAGDRLWVRESYRMRDGEYIYKADWTDNQPSVFRWKPSIHMPKTASRILLEIESIQVERLRAISDDDCRKEGCSGGHGSIPGYGYSAQPKEHYFWLWDKINGKNASNANPWVWVIQFRVVQP